MSGLFCSYLYAWSYVGHSLDICVASHMIFCQILCKIRTGLLEFMEIDNLAWWTWQYSWPNNCQAICLIWTWPGLHTVNFSLEMVKTKHLSWKNIFHSTEKDKNREEIIFEILHCPFAQCVIWNSYQVMQSIVAKLKNHVAVRYPNKMAWLAPSQNLTKSVTKKERIASNRSHTLNKFEWGLETVNLSILS